MGAANGPCQCPGQKEAIVDLQVPAYNSEIQTNGGTGGMPVATSGQPPTPGWNCCCSENTGPEKGIGDSTQQFEHAEKQGLDYAVPQMASPYSADMNTGRSAPDASDDVPPPPGQFRENTANDDGCHSRGESRDRTPAEWAEDQDQFAGMPPLPDGWIRVKSRTTDSIYYCYTETGETTFTEPTGPPESVTGSTQRRGGGEVEDSDLPPGWTAVVSRSSGQTYYWHAGLQKSQFSKPTAADAVADDDDSMQHKISGQVRDDDLRPGWMKMVSRSTGKTYYFHTETQTSQFDRPT